MRAEVVFVAGYAGVLVAAAVGLRRLGRVNSSPWSSRLFAAYRRQVPDAPLPEVAVDWPHTEARRLYSGMAMVAALAAVVLAGVELARHHRPVEAVVLALVVVAGLVVVGRLAAELRPVSSG